MGDSELGARDLSAVGCRVGAVVGSTEGLRDGTGEGRGVGLVEGITVGSREGAGEGRGVGLKVGSDDGEALGRAEGRGVGRVEGITVGSREGAGEGSDDGEALGRSDGKALGLNVGAAVGTREGWAEGSELIAKTRASRRKSAATPGESSRSRDGRVGREGAVTTAPPRRLWPGTSPLVFFVALEEKSSDSPGVKTRAAAKAPQRRSDMGACPKR